jgi:hypothetical protein
MSGCPAPASLPLELFLTLRAAYYGESFFDEAIISGKGSACEFSITLGLRGRWIEEAY